MQMPDMMQMQQGEEMPSELQDLMDELKAAQNAKIEQVGKYVARLRDEAVKGRRQSGIEQIWQEDLEFYEGIDEANRDQTRWLKSPATSGGISRSPIKSSTRCTAFFNVTRPFVDAAAARMGDILLPAGDCNYSIEPTPVQDLPDENTVPEQVAQMLAQLQQQAEAACERAKKVLEDWLVECCYATEVRKVLEDAAKLGTGVLKGPFPKKFTAKKATRAQDGVQFEIISKTGPASLHIDPWDFFPDPSCGDSIHNGNYVFERSLMTAKQLKKLKGTKGYLDDQIDSVLEEGPAKKNYSEGYRLPDQRTSDEDRYEVWYFYGDVDVDALSAMKVSMDGQDQSKNKLPAVVTLVNDTPIKAFLNPLDTGEFPYDVMVWQRSTGSPWGIGVARQGRTPQEMLNASARALMDNAGLSSGPMLIVRKGAILPADGQWTVTARKVWYATESADVRTVADAFTAINVPMVQAELAANIQLAYKMMEDSTGIPFLLLGQQGAAPDTVGGMEMVNRNASAVLRRLARIYDEQVTEPHIRRYYDWLMLHGPDDAKGDYTVKAVGSTALVEREIQAMEAAVLLQSALNPAYGLNPEKTMTEYLKAKRLIPEKFQFTEEEKKAQQEQPPPPVPAIEVAKIRAEVDTKRMQLDALKADKHAQLDAERNKVNLDRDLLYSRTMALRDQTTREIRIEEMRMKRDLAMLDYSSKHNITLEQIKAKLASDAMKLRTMKELSRNKGQSVETIKPPAEPIQHAPNGRSFQE